MMTVTDKASLNVRIFSLVLLGTLRFAQPTQSPIVGWAKRSVPNRHAQRLPMD